MSDESKRTWVLDLDTSEFMEKAMQAKEHIEKIGDSENVAGLIEGLTAVAGGIAVVGLAAFALKATFEQVFDAENIRAVNEQFEHLAHNAGISADKLKEGLVESAHGLIAENELLQIANKAIIEMGGSAEKLPQLLNLARQAASSMGGTVTERFEQMNQAIAMGSTRALKHMGIMIDERKAIRDFAISIGESEESLSRAGRSHAILNAVLEQGGDAFKGINPNIKENQNLWEQTKVTFKEVGEVATLAFAKIAGPAVKASLGWLANAAHGLKLALVENLGSGAESAAAHAERLTIKLEGLKEKVKDLEAQQTKFAGGDPYAASARAAQIASLTKHIQDYEKELGIAKQAEEKFKEAEPKSEGAATNKRDDVDHEKKRQAEIKFKAEILAIDSATLKDQIKILDTYEAADKADKRQRELLAQETALKIQKIEHEYVGRTTERNRLIEATQAESNAKLAAMEDSLKEKREASLKEYLHHSQSTAQGIERAFQVASQQARIDMADFGKRGADVMDSFKTNAVSNLEAVGDGSKSAADAAKGFIFGMLGERAVAEGTLMMLSGIWPPNPAALAGGAALVALGGYLKGQAGGGAGGGASVPSVAVTGATPALGDSSSASANTPLSSSLNSASSTTPKAVTIQIQGHYFETDTTRRALVDMIRQESDATDFKFVGVGGN